MKINSTFLFALTCFWTGIAIFLSACDRIPAKEALASGLEEAAREAKPKRPLTSQWHKEEEAKIDHGAMILVQMGKWNPQWDKFSMLGTYEWRSGMNCGTDDKPLPCMSGGCNYSPEAFERLKVGDLSHNAHNTIEEGAQMLMELHRR